MHNLGTCETGHFAKAVGTKDYVERVRLCIGHQETPIYEYNLPVENELFGNGKTEKRKNGTQLKHIDVKQHLLQKRTHIHNKIDRFSHFSSLNLSNKQNKTIQKFNAGIIFAFQ